MPSQPYGARALVYLGGGARMLLPDPAPDGEIYVSTAQAAEAMRLQPPAIRRWVKIGYLPEAAPGVYAFSAVTAAEKLARDAEARTRFQPVAA